jgi:4'-phosphopantetheinyl transferase
MAAAFVHEAIAAQARRRPDAVAVTDRGRDWTYAQLIVAADVACASAQDVSVLRGLGVMPLAAPSDGVGHDDPACPGASGASPAPAYAIFTSGSTGAPKGVRVGHLALAASADSLATRIGLDERDRVLQFDESFAAIGVGQPHVRQVLRRLPGVAGADGTAELFVGGPALADWYPDDPRLTATEFVPDADGNGTRFYCTGDLVRCAGAAAYRDRAGRVRVGACVECATNEQDLSGLDGLLREHLPAQVVPIELRVVVELPRLPTGKWIMRGSARHSARRVDPAPAPVRVHVAAAGPDFDATDLRAHVPAGESQRIATFRRPDDRRARTLAWAMVGVELAALTNQPAAALRFVRGPHGKPALAGEAGRRHRFSVAHSGRVAVVAFAEDVDVGVDVEQPTDMPLDELLGVLELVGAPPLSLQACAPLEARRRAALRAWTRIEALGKLTGRGLARPCDPPCGCACCIAACHARRSSVVELPLPDGHVGAVAYAGEARLSVRWLHAGAPFGGRTARWARDGSTKPA